MKKAFLIIALLFTVFSSNIALAGYQSYTSPWRFPYYESDGDKIDVNINSYCSYLQLSGTFYPSSSWPTGDTYCDFSFYDSGYGSIYGYYYGIYGNSDPSFNYVNSNYTYWGVIAAHANVSNGSATYSVYWY